MGRQLKGLLYFYITDTRRSFFIFWSILLITMSLTIIGAYFLMNVEGAVMYFSPSSALYIYCAITGFIIVKEGIPFSIKMGATRKNLYAGLGLFFLGLSILKAVMVSTIHTILESITTGSGIDIYTLVHPSQLLTDTWTTRVIIDTALMFFLLSFMFILGLVFYKYGLLGGGSVAGLLVIILLFGVAQGWVGDFFVNVYQSLDLTFFYQVLLIGVVLYGISWILLRRITIVKVN